MLTKEDIKHIAGLARIGLSKSEISKYQKELSVILDYFKKLSKANTDKIESIGHITEIDNVYREDVICDADKNKQKIIIQNVPQKKDNQIKVRSVLK